jgi:hypothetical protein
MDFSLCRFHYIDFTKIGQRKYRKAFSHGSSGIWSTKSRQQHPTLKKALAFM